jgi:hypothetical protein
MKPVLKLMSQGFLEGVRELDAFFQGRDPVHKTMKRVVKRLEKAGIPYAVVGGMAVFAHQYRRATNDVDLLLTPAGFDEFLRRFVPKNYTRVEGQPRRFVDQVNDVTIDILVTGRFPGSGKPGPIAYPDPETVGQAIGEVLFVNLACLIELKLAARRHRDFGDVVSLIHVHNLDESFQNQLHPSVHRDFIECLEEKRREDEYEDREGKD